MKITVRQRQFRKPGDADDSLLAPIALRELAAANVVREVKLVFDQTAEAWIVEIYHGGRWRRLRMWDKAAPRLFRDANSAARQIASLGIAELRVNLASVPNPDVLTRAKRAARSKP